MAGWNPGPAQAELSRRLTEGWCRWQGFPFLRFSLGIVLAPANGGQHFPGEVEDVETHYPFPGGGLERWALPARLRRLRRKPRRAARPAPARRAGGSGDRSHGGSPPPREGSPDGRDGGGAHPATPPTTNRLTQPRPR